MNARETQSADVFARKIQALEEEITRLRAKQRQDDTVGTRALLTVATRKKAWYEARIEALRRKVA